MADLANLESASHAFDARVLLDGVSLGVGAGEVIGVVGRSRDGKTTLLRVLTDDLVPDSGRVTTLNSASIGILAQHQAGSPGETVRQVILDGAADHVYAARADRWEIVETLLAGVDLDRPVETLSGNEWKRVGLVEMLLGDHNLIALDKPTSHLGVEVVAFLASRLRSHTAVGLTILVVDHDHWFPDAVCTRIWKVRDGVVDAYDSGYAAYVLTRVERQRQTATTEARRKNLARKELTWLRRGAPARTLKPKFRIEAAETLISDASPSRDRLALGKFTTSRLGKDIFDLINVDYVVEDHMLPSRLAWSIGPGNRIELVGVNGAGKATLPGLLAGLGSPQNGKIERSVTLRIGYLSQGVGGLNDEDHVLQFVTRLEQTTRSATGREVSAGNLLEEFGFIGDKLVARIGDLSGGERRCLQFLRLLLEKPNVLLPDGPTNDLDIDTLTVIEDYLDTWPGTLIVVSRDRYFLKHVTDASWALLSDGSCVLLPDGVEEYLERRRGAKNTSPTPTPPVEDRPRSGTAVECARKKGLACLESRFSKMESEIERIHDVMAASAADFERLAVLDADLRAARAHKDKLEGAWLLTTE